MAYVHALESSELPGQSRVVAHFAQCLLGDGELYQTVNFYEIGTMNEQG